MQTLITITRVFPVEGGPALAEFYGHPDGAFDDACAAVAEWAGVDQSELDFTETEAGDFFTLDGEPIAKLATRYARP